MRYNDNLLQNSIRWNYKVSVAGNSKFCNSTSRRWMFDPLMPVRKKGFLKCSLDEVQNASALDINLTTFHGLSREIGCSSNGKLKESESSKTVEEKPKTFKNKFLDFVRIGSVINNAAESFFKSEIRRRLFVTAALLVVSRLGYFIPLPGFDRRLIPQNYLSFVSGSVGEF